MKDYYVNKQAQANGDHEVHREDCHYLPSPANRHSLGIFSSCEEAVKVAKRTFPRSNGCFHCSENCKKQIHFFVFIRMLNEFLFINVSKYVKVFT